MVVSCACGGNVVWKDSLGQVCEASGAVVVGPLGTYFDCPNTKAARAVAAVVADGTVPGTDIRGNGCVKCGAGSGAGLCGDCYTENEPVMPLELRRPSDPPLTLGQVKTLRTRAILALRDYRAGLVAIKALKPATDRVDNALNHLGA